MEEPAATGTITGRVIIAETGEPAVGAQVSVDNVSRGAVTDARGRFVITGIPAGAHALDVRTKGYSGKEAVSVAAGEATTVSAISLNPMTAVEVSKFDKAEVIQEPRWKDAVKSAIATRPLIILNGIPLGDNSDWLKNLDPDLIDKIEVVKGPAAAALYGERARDGVILIYTKR
jgi:TonB-dependent SusC/RagA subfamily outer membrane receptor